MASNFCVSLTIFSLILVHCAVGISSRSLSENRQLSDLLPPWIRRYFSSVEVDQETDKPKSKEPTEVLNWPSTEFDFGQITAVAVDPNSNPVIFHRGPVKWDSNSFGSNDQYKHVNKGPIKEKLIVTLDDRTGAVLNQWGNDLFYMPHGLEIDANGNTWVTDVALHQVFKFPSGSQVPSLTLGTAFVPGHDDSHFCKPTDIAVASTGIFFVSDGYCNQRILKYSPDGALIDTFKAPFNIPHSLALQEDIDTLCVADREHSRILCFKAGLTNSKEFGIPVGSSSRGATGPVYAVAIKGNNLYAVSGSAGLKKASGYTFHLDELDGKPKMWSPSKNLNRPHDLAISHDGESMFIVAIGPNRIVKFALE